MNTLTSTPLNLRSFYRFSKLDLAGQNKLIAEKGVLLDTLETRDMCVRIFFLEGYFVEQTLEINHRVVSNVPFRQGHRLSQFHFSKKAA